MILTGCPSAYRLESRRTAFCFNKGVVKNLFLYQKFRIYILKILNQLECFLK